jgi:UDP-N-acetylglucosamine 2-epimerase (non-hydrolysing)
MITVLSVFGTRPEAIKMAPVIKELERYPQAIRSVICSVGQHRQMLDQVMDLFQLKPDYDLDLMEADQQLPRLTARLFAGLDTVIADVKPDWVLAQGDTTTVFVAAMNAFYRGVAFGHVEAGLRTGNRRQPYPEEVNRRIADLVADAYFAPTTRARDALIAEGSPERDIYVTGNTVIDALYETADRDYRWESGPLAPIPPERRLVLITAHRRESFGPPFRELCLAIRELAQEFADRHVHFVYPVHLNPNVRQPVMSLLSEIENVSLIEPLDYLSLVHLMKRSTLVLTDSGGIQEEAPAFQIPVLVMRDTTERPEGLATGLVKLVGTDRERIVEEARRVLAVPPPSTVGTRAPSPYGDGHAAKRIVSVLRRRAGFLPDADVDLSLPTQDSGGVLIDRGDNAPCSEVFDA